MVNGPYWLLLARRIASLLTVAVFLVMRWQRDIAVLVFIEAWGVTMTPGRGGRWELLAGQDIGRANDVSLAR